MEEPEKIFKQEVIFSKLVKAGKRTYFFDIKLTRNNDYYLIITESKKLYNSESGKFYYHKNKILLYLDQLEKFISGLKAVKENATQNLLLTPHEEFVHIETKNSDLEDVIYK
ncbi:MAG: PUR family DNA/RNA-binding protein [Lentimicrobiaceae bacterium]|jgi:hypothetical protein|nr:PUR family DNA/RNA-binding protein [Lentimicrobiaceae bacterium]